MSFRPNIFAVSKDKFILFKSDHLPATVASSPRIEFIIAVSNALDADTSRVNAFSPSDAVWTAVAWAAVIPTISRFSVNSDNLAFVSSRLLRVAIKSLMRELQEQRRYSSFFNAQN